MTETELLRTYRRDLHRIPELDKDLPETIAYVRARLEELGDACTVVTPCESSLCAVFDSGTERATAVRTDMDALPVTERTGAAYASRHEGRMHACGHDGHMAMALGLCRWLAAHRDELPRTVMVVFQPAEETEGGASGICESGVFERYGVDRIFGFHLWPDLPFGQVASRPGALLASSNEVDVTLAGRGSHIAKWQEGRDALLCSARVAAGIYERSDALVTEEPVLLRFGALRAGTVRNAIAASGEVHGSLRTFSEHDRRAAMETIRLTACEAAEGLGCSADVHFSVGDPVVANDSALFALAAQAVPELETLPEPLLIADDFAWYQQQLPGLYILLGTGTGIPLHADTFDFDEAVLQLGLDVYKRLVVAG